MRILILLSISSLTLADYTPCSGKSVLGKDCDQNSDCEHKGSVCLRGKCRCHPHYIEVVDDKGQRPHCQMLPARIGAPCTTKCREPLFCRNGGCQCVQRGTTTLVNGECISLSRVGDRCTRHYDCTAPFSACLNQQCVCISGTIQQGSRCVAAANCPFGGLPGATCVQRTQSGSAFNLPQNQSNCPLGQMCIAAEDSSVGHCCPVVCPLASHVDQKYSCDPMAGTDRCPSDTHFCHLLSDGYFSQAVCCRRPCNAMAPNALYANNQCVPRGQLNAACTTNAQCGGGESMECIKDFEEDQDDDVIISTTTVTDNTIGNETQHEEVDSDEDLLKALLRFKRAAPRTWKRGRSGRSSIGPLPNKERIAAITKDRVQFIRHESHPSHKASSPPKPNRVKPSIPKSPPVVASVVPIAVAPRAIMPPFMKTTNETTSPTTPITLNDPIFSTTPRTFTEPTFPTIPLTRHESTLSTTPSTSLITKNTVPTTSTTPTTIMKIRKLKEIGQCQCLMGFTPAVDSLTNPRSNPSQTCIRECSTMDLARDTSCFKQVPLGGQCFIQKQCPMNAGCYRGRCMCRCGFELTPNGKCIALPPPTTTTQAPRQSQIAPGAPDILSLFGQFFGGQGRFGG